MRDEQSIVRITYARAYAETRWTKIPTFKAKSKGEKKNQEKNTVLLFYYCNSFSYKFTAFAKSIVLRVFFILLLFFRFCCPHLRSLCQPEPEHGDDEAKFDDDENDVRNAHYRLRYACAQQQQCLFTVLCNARIVLGLNP